MASLLEVVESMELGTDADSMRDALAAVDRMQAKLAVAVAAFIDAGDWEIDGSPSPIAWLREHGRMSSGHAGWLARMAKRMGEFPAVAEAWCSGKLSGGQVQAIVANTCDKTAAMFAEQERALIPYLAPLDANACAIAMAHWRSRALDRLKQKAPQERPRSLYCSKTLGGRREIKGNIGAEAGERLDTALRLASRDDHEGEVRTPAERRADALDDICEFFLTHQRDRVGGRHRPHLNLVARQTPEGGWLATLQDGTPIAHASFERLLCDCIVHKVTESAGTILDYGRSVRTAPPNLFNALVVRDGGCRICGRAPQFCEAHHVQFWEDGGNTSIDHMALMCWAHHDTIHRKGWKLRLEPDGVLHIKTPDGRSWTTYPPGMLRPEVAA